MELMLEKDLKLKIHIYFLFAGIWKEAISI